MSIQEMKKNIVERIENINTDAALVEVVKFLDALENTGSKPVNLSAQYEKISGQYNEVLKKLAE